MYLLTIWTCFLEGNKVEKLCDLCDITVNKNAVFGDSSALAPGGVRIGKTIPFKIIGVSLIFQLLHYANFSLILHSSNKIIGNCQMQHISLL